ncbi:MAG: Trk system potassium transporter TrkA [Bacteroidales bacterium]|nr:Trk system potassium transporter TrkA [Bacteroidales bacterium]
MRIVIQGAGAVGSHLAKMLRSEGNTVTVIDNDEGRLHGLASVADVNTLEGNPSSTKVLRAAGVDKADLFIAVYPSEMQEMNIVGALLAKKLGAAKVIARINDEDYLSAENRKFFHDMGIELLLYPEKIAADEIVARLKRSTSAETMDFASRHLQFSVFKLDESSPLLDLKLIDFMGRFSPEQAAGFRIVAISRGERTMVPKVDTVFQYADLVFVVAMPEALDLLVEYFGQNSLSVENVMIIGGNAIAEMVARRLSKEGIAVKLVEIDRDHCIRLEEDLPEEVDIVHGDGRDSDLLFEEGVKDCDAFVALTGSDETNVLACVVAKRFGVPRTVAEVENTEYVRLAEDMGIDHVINKKLITAGRIYKFTLGSNARFVKYMRGTNAEVLEYTAHEGSPITRKPLKDIKFPDGAIICGVTRGARSMIAVGDTVIEPGDQVAIFALPETVKTLDKLFK